jgi:serine/threonine protein phosphatase PrpC
VVRCPSCGAISPPSSRFCERDGSKLVAEGSVAQLAPDLNPVLAACPCGSTTYEDGFCTVCGRGASSPSRAFDHVEQAPVPELAGVTDRGLRHAWNEDALSLAAERLEQPAYVAVVCDGVSQARGAQQAAQVAAEVARGRLLEAARGNVEPTAAMRQAILAAHVAVCDLPDPEVPALDGSKTQPPGCTLVAALVRNGHATIGWVGDSRAYRFASDLTQLLTHDHSWFNAVVDAGEMSPLEAAASSNCNAILRAVGPLNFDEGAPHQAPAADVVSCDLLPGHVLLLCSDGLWKYAPEAVELAELVRAAPRGAGPLELACRLVDFANTRGGTDNVTAVILRRT